MADEFGLEISSKGRIEFYLSLLISNNEFFKRFEILKESDLNFFVMELAIDAGQSTFFKIINSEIFLR